MIKKIIFNAVSCIALCNPILVALNPGLSFKDIEQNLEEESKAAQTNKPEKSKNLKNAYYSNLLNKEQERICSLPEHKNALKRFKQFQNELEEFEAIKIKEMHEDQDYQRNIAAIKTAILEAFRYCQNNNNLSDPECEQLVQALNTRFFPD